MADLESTVWMIHAGTSRDGVKGRLALEPGAVVFRGAQAGPGGGTTFSLAAIRRAHRAMGTPVLELNLQPNAGPGPRVVGFYFVQPPSLEAQADSGFFGWGLIKTLNRLEVAWSITVTMNPSAAKAIAAIQFDAQGLVTVATPRLLRKLGDLQPAELVRIEDAVKRWLGL